MVVVAFAGAFFAGVAFLVVAFAVEVLAFTGAALLVLLADSLTPDFLALAATRLFNLAALLA